jgi:hypothetical protein
LRLQAARLGDLKSEIHIFLAETHHQMVGDTFLARHREDTEYAVDLPQRICAGLKNAELETVVPPSVFR